jgi:lipoprotein-anchoring transpeptidase ErfK/SrfK
MLQTPGAKNVGHNALRRIVVAVAGLAISPFVLPSSLAIAQESGPWLGFGAQSQRRPVRPNRHGLSPKVARHTDNDTQRLPKRKSEEIGDNKKGAARSAGPLFAILSLSDQHISIYNSSGLVAGGKVSTGMPGHRTPSGIFTIIGRERYHHSNIYSGAPMPFMQRITWSGIALHMGVVPGYPASHGCIRLPAGFAQQLWGMIRIGERVVVSPHEVKPAEIAHPLLPVAKLQPAPAMVSGSTPTESLKAGTALEVASTKSDALPETAVSGSTPRKLLNPIQYAEVMKVRASAETAAATKAIKESAEKTGAASAEARKAAAALRAAEAAHAQAESRLAAKTKALDQAKTPEAQDKAQAAKTAEEAQVLDATKKLEEAKSLEALKTSEASDAERAAKEARAALATAQALGREAARRASPVSVLVSKKDMRVYIRQGLAPVLDAPVKIRDPDVPLGTHVYIASSAQSGPPSLGWSVVSMPASTADVTTRNSRQEANRSQKDVRPEPVSPSNAAAALDRIELPKDVSERISQLLWAGGSLIISDRPLSDETSDIGTDLVVTMR